MNEFSVSQQVAKTETVDWQSPFMPKRGMSVVVLSFNEEANIAICIDSLKQLSDDIWIVDSNSTDRTVEIAASKGVNVVSQKWLGFSHQWNFALQSLPYHHPLVMLHASDEQIPEVWAKELKTQFDSPTPPDMVQTRFRFWWMDKPVTHGGYGKTYIVKAGKRELMQYENRSVNEHIPLQGKIYLMNERYEHRDAKEVPRWIDKHIKYAQLEANERIRARGENKLRPKFFGAGQASRVLWIRQNIYDRIPPIIRPLSYFFYRYFLRFGFLDGLSGTYFHILHGFWFPMLIDIFEKETLREQKAQQKQPQ